MKVDDGKVGHNIGTAFGAKGIKKDNEEVH
jgi:hypothetical protein